ncbi:MAG TPA: DUF3108 domain-containing protein [Candidatus Binatia bacterium]
MLRFLFLTSLALCPAFGLAADIQEPLQNYTPRFRPFDGGEKAFYQASWMGIPVASTEIETQPVVLDGKKFYHVTVKAESWRYLDFIFKMRDRIESTFDAETLHPRRFFFSQRENKKVIDTTAEIDPATHKWVVRRKEGKRRKDFEFESPYTLDTVSAVYLARSLDFKVGDRFRLEVFGGKSRYLVTLDVVGKERIRVNKGEFETYKIVPKVVDLSKTGYAQRVREATAWITADEKRMPIKMSTQVFWGSVNIELTDGKS